MTDLVPKKLLRIKLGRIYSPYCIRKLKSGRFVLLNRYYKPLGITGEERLDYEQFSILLRMRAKTAKALSSDGEGLKACDDDDSERILWLYDDANDPFRRPLPEDTPDRKMKALASMRRIQLAMTLCTQADPDTGVVL